MSVANNLKKQIDLPVWEWCRFTPVVSSTALSLCSDESSGGRYIYYIGTTCWRYDTWTDGWQQIATHNGTLSAVGATRYSVYGGYRGRAISATSTTLTLAGLQGQKLLGKTIRITQGKGAGQERVIRSVSEPIIVEYGIASIASATAITDAQTIPKKWKINQWAGYQCRLVFGTGASQIRKILYNDTNTLTFSDTNWQAYDSWNNTGFSVLTPYAAPVATVASVSNYYIEYSTITVDEWTTTPDLSSRYMILSGGIWFLHGKTLAQGSASLQYYDVLSDTWQTKTCPGGMFPVLAQSDVTIERIGEISGSFATGNLTSASYDPNTRKITDTSANFVIDRYANFQLRIVNSSTGIEMRRRILGNTSTNIFLDKPVDVSVHNATYSIYGDTNAIWTTGNSQSSMYKYMIEEDLWTDSQNSDSGVVKNMSAGRIGRMAYGVASVTVNASSLTGVNSTPTVAGTGYKVGDICNVSTGTTGNAGKIRVVNINPSNGAVTALELYAPGNTGTYTIAAGKTTVNLIPASGGGSGLQVQCTSAGATLYATTSMNHDLIVEDTVLFAGASVSAWNVSTNVIACDALTTYYSYVPTGALGLIAPVAASTNVTTAIIDSEKIWTVDEHAGKLVTLWPAGQNPLPVSFTRKIISNSSTGLNLLGGLFAAGTTGTSRYLIHDPNFFGKEDQTKVAGQEPDGWACCGYVSSTNSTLVDNTKSWIPGQWNGYKMRVLCGTGFNMGEVSIAYNDASSLTISSSTFTPDTTTKYRIEDTYGMITSGASATVITDAAKNWSVNQWAGKSIRLWLSANSTATNVPVEVIATANTATTITYATTTTLNDPSNGYTILSPPIRNIGMQAMWNYGSSDTSTKGKYLYVPRGGTTVTVGTNLLDRYDIIHDKWDLSLVTNPEFELQTLGSQWAYDGKDKIYWTASGAQSTRVNAIDINTFSMDPAGIHPYANAVAVQGNRMEIITTVDGLMYLYLIRVAGSEMFRTLLWWQYIT